MLKTWYPRIHWFTILLSMQNAIFRRTLSCSSLHEAANPRLGVEGKSTANPLRGSTSWQTSTQKSCRWCSRRLAAPSDIIRYNQIYNKHICIYTYDEHIYIYSVYIYIYTLNILFFSWRSIESARKTAWVRSIPGVWSQQMDAWATWMTRRWRAQRMLCLFVASYHYM